MRFFWQQIKTACFDHRWLGLVGCLYALLVIMQCVIVGVPPYEYRKAFGLMLKASSWSFLFALSMMLLFFFYSYVMAAWETSWRGKKLRGYFPAVAKLFDKKCEHYFDSRLFADGLIGFLVLQVMDFVGSQKSLIPYLNPFKWDPFFARWDQLLHFGYHPFRLVLPLVDSIGSWGAKGLSLCYAGWFFAMFGTCFYCIFMDSSFYRHMRFLWTYLLTWVLLGSCSALLFSSVGPVYFHDFYPQLPDLYRPLIDHLDQTELGVEFGGYSVVVSLLLKWARNDLILDFNAISAMPSLHVGIAWLLVLYWGGVNRWMMILAAAFFVMIFLGSIYLGFHYAIDSYYSVIGISLIWWGSGRLVHRLHPHARDLIRTAK